MWVTLFVVLTAADCIATQSSFRASRQRTASFLTATACARYHHLLLDLATTSKQSIRHCRTGWSGNSFGAHIVFLMAPSLAHSVNGLLLALAAGSGFTVPRRMLCYNLLGKQSGDTAVAPQILPSPPGLLEGICGMVAAGEDSGGISTALVPVSVCLCDDHIVKLATGPPLSHAIPTKLTILVISPVFWRLMDVGSGRAATWLGRYRRRYISRFCGLCDR